MPKKKKTEEAAEAKPVEQEAKKEAKPVSFERGQQVKISATDSDGIFLKVLPNGNARCVCSRNRIEVIDMAVLRKLNG